MNQASKHLQELYALFLTPKTTGEMKDLMDDLLTPQELRSVAERWQIIQALTRGMPQREIAERLNTSIGKITRGSRVVQYGKINWSKKIKK
ncbi:transcriptional regulator [Patescibacteria group bacterium]|nr:transcriptional regulator [Patescibacteria group bacterium]MBP9710010.1 transcriptional regulator [Patescibacteria group bacterium]